MNDLQVCQLQEKSHDQQINGDTAILSPISSGNSEKATRKTFDASKVFNSKAKLQQWFQHRHPPGKHAAGDEIRPQKVQTPDASSALQLQKMVTVVLQLQGDRHQCARRGQQAQVRVLLQLLHQTLE